MTFEYCSDCDGCGNISMVFNTKSGGKFCSCCVSPSQQQEYEEVKGAKPRNVLLRDGKYWKTKSIDFTSPPKYAWQS